MQNALGLCLAKLGRTAEACQAFRACAALAPRFGPAHYNSGWALEELGELDLAREAFGEANRLDPKAPDPLGRLAALAARRGHWAEARAFAEQALALAPNQAAATIALANADLAAGLYPAAVSRVRALIDSPSSLIQDRATAAGLLGDILDAQERYPEAFAAYAAGNALFKTVYAEKQAIKSEMAMSDYVRWLRDSFAGMTAWPQGEAPAPAPEAPDLHIFVLGFPRSGTTLLEEVLACHPQASTTGEKDALADIVRELLAKPSDIARLRTLDRTAIDRYRARYRRTLEGLGVGVKGRVLIDKQPFNTVRLPLIARLFPEAKIVFCLRDPRDVALSCFRRRFAPNSANAEFLTLEDTARLYDSVMQLANTYKAVLPLALHEIRNEDLVKDFEPTLRALCAFAGIDWIAAFHEFAQRSGNRQVSTPSAAQIKRGLGSESISHWRHYEAEMAPVLPVLNDWARRLGYEDREIAEDGASDR